MDEPTNAPEHDATPTLDEVVRRRGTLYQAILALEQAAARPAVGREEQWLAGIVAGLEELEREIADHIDVTERPGGLYTEIVERAPRLSHGIHVLRAEHPEMQHAARALKARLVASEVPPVDEVRDDVQRVLGRLVKHRQRGADLLWEAYSLDTGGSD
jgi:predicted transcriptional regulator